MAYVRNVLYKTSTTAKPWPLWGRLLFWVVVLGILVDWIM